MTQLALALTMGAVQKPVSLALRALAAVKRAGGTVLAAGAATPVLGENLVTNGDFSNGTAGWDPQATATLAVSGGMMEITCTGAGYGMASRTVSLVIGKTYWLQASSPDSVVTVRINNATSGSPLASLELTPSPAFVLYTATETTVAVTMHSNSNVAGTKRKFGQIILKEFSGYTYGNPPVRNYFDSDGTDILDSVTQVDQPVGLVLDAAGVLGPELVTNGDFSAGSDGWSVPAGWAVASGTCTATATSASFRKLDTPSVAGKTYIVEFDWAHAGGVLYVRMGAGAATTFTTSGRKKAILVAASTAGIEFYGGGVSGSLDNITAREVTGNHASQATTGSKPTLRRGLVNQLLYSQWGGGGNAPTGWTAFGGGGVEGALLPSGMRQRVFTSAASQDFIYQTIALAANTTYTFALSVDANPGNLINGALVGYSTIPAGTSFTVASSASVASVGSTILVTIVVGAAAGNMRLRVGPGSQTVTTGSVTLSAPALFQGTVTAQQIIAAGGIPLTTTAPASSALGNYWWQFDPAAPGDFFNIGTGAIGANVDIFIGATRTKDKCVLLDGMDGGGGKYVGVIDATNTSVLATNGIGTAFTTFVNGVAVGSVGYLTRGQLTAAWPIGSTAVLEFRNVDLSTWTALRLFGYPTFEFGGSCASVVIAQAGSDRALIRAWVAKQQGQTL